MNKFTIAEMPKEEKEAINIDLPVLYRVHIGSMYYLHKGKSLEESLSKLLDDVFRGVRDLKCSEAYSKFVQYCKRYPALHRVQVEVVLNAEAAKVLAAEDKQYKLMKNDEASLNRLDIAPYKPEWMLKEKFQARCEECIKNGIVNGKKIKFRFCPNCGKVIK